MCVDIGGQAGAERVVLGGCNDRTVRLWQLSTQRLKHSFTGDSSVYIQYSSD
jgi:hypothetical protein